MSNTFEIGNNIVRVEDWTDAACSSNQKWRAIINPDERFLICFGETRDEAIQAAHRCIDGGGPIHWHPKGELK
jgi:hypothetical protein